MVVTQTDICNRALLAAGTRTQISGFPPTDVSVEAQTCQTLYLPTYEALANSAQWNCFRRQALLTLIAAAAGTSENPDGVTLPIPPIPWSFEYAYPSDCLSLSWIVPNYLGSGDTAITTANNSAILSLPSGNQIPYASIIDYLSTAPNTPVRAIVTNQESAIAVYTMDQPDPQYWDTLFSQAMVASLAAFLVPALSLSAPLMKTNIEIADKIIAEAKTSDANEGVTIMDHIPDWMIARLGGMGIRYGYSGASDSSMNWPSYN